ncbi:ATP-binding protein [Phenylobacterium sp.]|uniref:hybrid sensor histidine kinase/response regulator n=1 Tax=Phenylobacterium sp. TaxID=1871053 RepID=UPI003D2CE7BF
MAQATRFGLTEGQSALRRLMALGAALLALVLLGLAALLIAGSQALDSLQVREDRAMVDNVLGRRLHRIVTDVTTATVWNQAYRELRPGGSVEWLDDEIGSYFAQNRGHDLTIALDGADRPFYAWSGKSRVDPRSQATFLADAAPIVRQARAQEGRRRPDPQVGDAESNLAETASGVVLSKGAPYLVAASTVTPEDASVPRLPGPAPLVISAQRLDRETPALLAATGIAGARFQRGVSDSPASMVVRTAEGVPIGEIVWMQRHPGLQALKTAAPVLALGCIVLLGVMLALGWQILRVARRLVIHERGHADALNELKVARDRAESASIAKSQFLANMSHEIRTPLNGVLGMAQVLAKSDLTQADRDKVRLIRASGETLLSLLNDLLDLSKIEAGRVDIEAHDFDLEAEVDTATRSFATLAAQKDVRFLLTVQPEVRGMWRGDAGRIRQVISNLVSNAVKFTDNGEVRVSLRRTDEGVVCTVSDSGVGIARDTLERLFERFSQVDPSATRRFGGSGLGLAISRELVELMGGSISVTSVEGRGSAFTFELPLPWVGPGRAVASTPEAESELPPIRILAAEDNRTNQLLLTAILDPLGVDVVITADGRAAVEAFNAQSFDLVLMDVQMPVMNGVDATHAIRAIEAERNLPQTPILALSANVMRHQVEEYLAAGMNGFVAKPIEMAALIDAISQALEARDTVHSAAA